MYFFKWKILQRPLVWLPGWRNWGSGFSLGACDASTEDCRARGRVGLIFVHRNEWESNPLHACSPPSTAKAETAGLPSGVVPGRHSCCLDVHCCQWINAVISGVSWQMGGIRHWSYSPESRLCINSKFTFYCNIPSDCYLFYLQDVWTTLDLFISLRMNNYSIKRRLNSA